MGTTASPWCYDGTPAADPNAADYSLKRPWVFRGVARLLRRRRILQIGPPEKIRALRRLAISWEQAQDTGSKS